jgi:hypothetical protein
MPAFESHRAVLCVTYSCTATESNWFIMTPRIRALNALNIVLKQGLTMKTAFCTGRCDVDANIGSLIRQSGVIADELSISEEDGLDMMTAGSLASLASQFGDEASRCGDPALSACLRLQSADLWRAIGDSGVDLQDERAM